MTALLEFDGVAFDPLAATSTVAPATAPHRDPAVDPRGNGVGGPAAELARLRAGIVAAHAGALAAHEALAHRALDALVGTRPAPGPAPRPVPALTAATAPDPATDPAPAPNPPVVPPPPCREEAFKPPARTTRRELDRAALDALAAGDLAGVFGPRHDQHGTNPDVRLHAGRPAALDAVTDLDVRGGAGGRGGLRATVVPGADLAAAAVEAVEVLALALGLPLVLARTALHHTTGTPTGPAALPAGVELVVDAGAVDLIPRPHVVARVLVRSGDEVLGWVPDVQVTVREQPGVSVAPDEHGRVASPGRFTAAGEPVLLGEFHTAHMARGEPGIGHGPQFAHLAGRRATRLPSHGLQLVDRIVAVHAARGAFTDATYTSEYDAPADSWYFADTANVDVPNVVLMETSLQSALVVGYFLGATLTDPGQDYVLRNLGGSATLRRELDLRDRTIRQQSRITATTPMSGSILQEFAYSLTVDGEPYYDGESMFGFFTGATMANQTGLDGGRTAPTWLERHAAADTRTIDVAARRRTRDGADTTRPAPARDHLALVDTITVVDGGGDHGQGYLHVAQPIDPDAWFFARHFLFDPVIPGSLGVEQVLQAMQEWALDAGLADDLDAPGFVVPVGATLTWRYRGQVLPTDGTTTFEVHLTGVERRPGRVRVSATASLWKPGLRIYELTGATVELREEGAPPW